MSDTLQRFLDAQDNLVVQHSDFSLRALHDMAEADSIDLEPKYQRRDRWTQVKQSALIESFILNVPVPPVYLSEDDFGKYSVIDGKQRITAISNFLAGKLRLIGLEQFPELNGSRFSDLPHQIQNALSIRPYIRVIILLKQTDPLLKYEVFLRLNTGGEKLLAQEIRNVAFSGTLNDLLITLSAHPFLAARMKTKSKSSSAYRNMHDVEHVLRFFTINERWGNFGQILSQEMDTYMSDNRNANSQRLASLKRRFISSIEACEAIWKDKAFYKPQENGWRSQFISPLYDAEMVAVSQFSDAKIAKLVSRRNEILKSFTQAYLNDPEFVKSVSQSTNNPSSIRKRITSIIEILTPFS